MRISSEKDDLGYPAFVEAQRGGKTIRIYLDGEEVKGAIVADDEAGFVQRAVVTSDGHVQICPNDPERFWVEGVYGDVRIVIG